MKQELILTGLDVGTAWTTVVISEITEAGFPEILGVGRQASQGLRKGVVVNIEATVRAIQAAVEQAEQMAGQEVTSVHAGISGGQIEGTNSKGVVKVTGRSREITDEDVERVLETARSVAIPLDREMLHVIPQDFIVDNHAGIKDPRDMIGVRLEALVHIITASATAAQNLVRSINRAGFRVDSIILNTIAAGMTVLSQDEQELGVLLLDLGEGTSDISVHRDGSPVFTSSLPVGGAQVTSDLSIMLKTPLQAARQIKHSAGCAYLQLVAGNEPVIIPGVGGRPPIAIDRRKIAGIIQPRVAEIFGLARDRLEQHDILRGIGGGVVLTGGGASLPGVVDLAQEVFGLPARVGTPLPEAGLVAEVSGPEFATAVGLIEYARQHVSIEEPDRRRQRDTKRVLHGIRGWLRRFFE